MHTQAENHTLFRNWIRNLACAAFLWPLAAVAQSPDGPITCPTTQVVNDVVCAHAELHQQTHVIESKYLSAVIGANIKDVHNAKRRWRGQFIQCGHLVMNKSAIDECILKSLDDYASELLKLAPELPMDRTALVKVAVDRAEFQLTLARERRMNCYKEAAAAIDDNTSSARDIAVVVTQKCRVTASQLADAMADSVEISSPMFNTAPSAQAVLSLSRDLSNPDDLIAFVLEQRLVRRQANRSTPKPKLNPAQGGKASRLEV